MRPQSAKAKGRRLQQWVGKQISKLIDRPFGPDEEIASREMSQSGTDIRLVGKAKKLFKYDIECKNCEKWSIFKWIEQAKSNTDKGRDWLIVAKRNRMDPVVMMDWKAFVKLFKRGMK